MMTRNLPAAGFSLGDLLRLVCGFIALSSATFVVACYAQEQRPVADFLRRAQSEINARRFEHLLSTLGMKPAAAVDRKEKLTDTAATPATSVPTNVDSVAAPVKTTAAPKSIEGKDYARAIAARLEKPRVVEARPQLQTEPQVQPQPQPGVQIRSKRVWSPKASGFLRRFGVRF